jgi:hypothetical protein
VSDELKLTEDEQNQIKQIRDAGAKVIETCCDLIIKGFKDNRIIAAMEDIIIKNNDRIADLESEVKALRLIANSHSMSELRRMKIMTNYKPGPEKEVKE